MRRLILVVVLCGTGVLALAQSSSTRQVIHVANGETPAKRTAEAANAIDAIGCRQLGVVQEGSPVDPDLFHWAFRTPKTVEPLAPLVNVIPLQLLSYYLAVQKGFDPDEARRAEPKFREAKSRFAL